MFIFFKCNTWRRNGNEARGQKHSRHGYKSLEHVEIIRNTLPLHFDVVEYQAKCQES